MRQVRLSRASKRRLNRRVEALISLLRENEKLFRREWHKQVQGWLGEVHHRARRWRDGVGDARAAFPEGRARVFGVLELAEALLAECGPVAEALVGEETRRLLTNECVKAVSRLCDGRLNYVVDHRVYHRARY